MNDEVAADIPVWLSDYEDIRQLLSSFLDKRDNNTRLLIRLTAKTVPTLFNFNHAESKTIWALIQKLDTDYSILTIEPDKNRADKEIYDNAKVRFNPEQEALVRHWLNRPKNIPYKKQWLSSVNRLQWSTSADVDYIRNTPLSLGEKTAQELASQLNVLEKTLTAPITLRTLSALHFWGDSKFLDNRLDYLQSAFPQQAKNIQTRPVLVNIYLPNLFKSVLFIENQDTFLLLAAMLTTIPGNTTALVYTAGFRGTATRIRRRTHYVFSCLSHTPADVINRFTQWWESQSDEKIPSFFWGDLDYSGLAILSALRTTFTDLTAWQPGYELMLHHHRQGNSHPLSSINKGAQIDPGNTGCNYGDKILLPAIREQTHFVDQEIVAMNTIRSHFTAENIS